MNVTLIGMPGAGKSTIGVILSKMMNLDFCDTDILIQRKHGKKLNELISKLGNEKFLTEESEVILSNKFDGFVIATGGSVIYKEKSMEYLKKISKIVYLRVPVDELNKRVHNLTGRGVVSLGGNTMEDIYNERKNLYEKYADVTVDAISSSLETCAKQIVDALKNQM